MQATARNHVTIAGNPEGPVLLLAHGFGCDQNMWARLVPAFEDDYRIVLFDYVGAGRSDLSAYESDKYASLDGYAADILDICRELELEDVILVGHSVSAMVAVTAAVAEPERFTRLILVAPSPRYIDDPSDGYVGGFSQDDIEELLDAVDSNYFGWASATAPMVMGNPDAPELGEELTGSFCATNPEIAHEFARVTFMSDSRGLLPQVRTPALVMQCSDDMLAPPEVGDYVHERMPDSTLVRLEATGHCPHVSAPEETSRAILGYLRSAA